MLGHHQRAALSACLLAAVFVCLGCVFGQAAAASNSGIVVRGAPPELDTSAKQFACDGGRVVLPWDRVNDDYCDCADGTDEPGTSACPNGKFYCANEGYRPLSIPSSFVNDAVCDCCDGSDEWVLGSCVNTCEEVGRSWREEQARRQRAFSAGQQLRQDAVAKYAAAREEWRSAVSDKRGQLTFARAELDVKRQRKDGAEQQLPSGGCRRDEPAPVAAAPADSEPSAEPADGSAPEAQEAAAAAETPAAPAPEPLPPLTAEERERCDLAESAAAAVRDAETRLAELEKAVRELEQKLEQDYGADGEFYVLDGQCFSHHTREYEYEICPFGEAKQKQNGSFGTSLGRFTGFSDDRSKMKFEHGQRCWGGPDRSATVTLECGSENKLVNAEEPSKCEYTFTLQTPCACV